MERKKIDELLMRHSTCYWDYCQNQIRYIEFETAVDLFEKIFNNLESQIEVLPPTKTSDDIKTFLRNTTRRESLMGIIHSLKEV